MATTSSLKIWVISKMEEFFTSDNVPKGDIFLIANFHLFPQLFFVFEIAIVMIN